jgi:hypothetical protein
MRRTILTAIALALAMGGATQSQDTQDPLAQALARLRAQQQTAPPPAPRGQQAYTCADFTASHNDENAPVMVWLFGYLAANHQELLTDNPDAFGSALGLICLKYPQRSLAQVVDRMAMTEPSGKPPR